MADLTYNINVNINKGFLSSQLVANGMSANMNLAGLKGDTYSLSTTSVSLSTANLSAVGLAFVRNLATATQATCTIGIEAGGSFVGFASPRPGEAAVFRMTPGTDYRAIGTQGTRLRVDITEG